jgi:hypothetical protein
MSTDSLTFQQRLTRVQFELKAPKNQFNGFGKYSYRSCEDILEALKPLLSKYELALKLSDTVEELGGVLFANARATIWDTDGTSAEVSAQAGIDVDKKGMDLSQTFGSASSYARKYALNGLFLIDDTKDADATNTHDKRTTPASSSREVLPKSGVKFNKAKEYLKNGGSINDIKTKYTVSKEVESLLNS